MNIGHAPIDCDVFILFGFRISKLCSMTINNTY